MRVAIIGNSGSGTSTLAQQIAVTHSLPSLDFDSVTWEPGEVGVARSADAAASDVRAFCEQHDRWVVEGCFADLTRRALGYSPMLLFMDPDGDLSQAEHQSLFEAYRGPKRRLTTTVDGAFVQKLPVRCYADGVEDLGSRFET